MCLVNILPKVFEVWRFPYIFVTFGNAFKLLGLYVDINGKILSFFSIFYFKDIPGELQELFQCPLQHFF